MFLYILTAVILAKMKGYQLKPLLHVYSLFPYIIVEALYLFFQWSIFLRNYSFIPYTNIINSIYLYTLIFPMLVYKLYKPGIIGSILILFGTFLNQFVMKQNGGKMPVYATLSKLTGYYDPLAIQTVDNIHIIGTDATKYKFLTDIFDTGFSILSIGDVLIHSFITIIIYYVIKEVNVNPLYTNENRKGNLLWNRLK